MSSSRANQALRSLANAGFQNRGVCLQAFPSFPTLFPLFNFLALVSFLTRPKYAKTGLSLLRNQTETLATQANLYLTIAINYTSVNSSCAHPRPRADPWVLALFCLGWQIPVGGDS